MAMITPGATIGILGGGQLGKMSALAAATLGYRTVVWAQDPNEPATQIATHRIIAPFEDQGAFRQFAQLADVATLEWENIPPELVARLTQVISMHPGEHVLRVTQDRWEEKQLFAKLGINRAPTILVNDDGGVDFYAQDPLASELLAGNGPAILKTRRGGYDGKGQIRLENWRDYRSAWEKLGRVPCIIEGLVNFAYEASVIVARTLSGDMEAFPMVRNVHRDGILRETFSPCEYATPNTIAYAEHMATNIAEELQVVGLIAVEMFITKDGDVLGNEMAPRTHNSGHGTIDGNYTSQFEQHIRAICGLPLGNPAPHSSWEMRNLIGTEVDEALPYLFLPNASVHIYGKAEVRPGRKMGHVTLVKETNR